MTLKPDSCSESDCDNDPLKTVLSEKNDTPHAPSFHEESDIYDFDLKTQLSPKSLPYDFGGYRLIREVGEGGAGIVFKGQSLQTKQTVAVKVIRPEILTSKIARQRFEKEARLHAEIDSPYVTKLYEYSNVKGVHFLACEFVDGKTLRDLISVHGQIPPEIGLLMVRDLLKALDAIHAMGVVHRDVKPENVMAILSGKDVGADDFWETYQSLKLADFGLARHVEQSESLALTKVHAMLGTPLYMAPEQFEASGEVDARADIYSLGASFHHMLSGRPVFEADDQFTMGKMHRAEMPQSLHRLDSNISEAIANVVLKALEKVPALRYQSAAEMLADVEALIAGRPTKIRLTPQTPDADQKEVSDFEFHWELDASVEQLWPLVSDTDQLNRAIGLPKPDFTIRHDQGVRTIEGAANYSGMKVRWIEHPFEWERERKFSVLREFASGPFVWVTSAVELQPLINQRTRLTHRFKARPRGWLGKLVAALQFNFLTPRALGRVYRRLEQLSKYDGQCRYHCLAPFDKEIRLNPTQQKRIEGGAEQLKEKHGQRLSSALSDYLNTVSDVNAARIRPLRLAKELDCSEDESFELCLDSVSAGLLTLGWDVICPVCRIATTNVSTIEQIDAHAHCEFCDLKFEVDFGQSVELIFRAHPEIRDLDTGTYCIGGPSHLPHVLAQSRLAADDEVTVGVNMQAGKHQVTSPQMNQVWNLNVGNDHLAEGNRYAGSVGDIADVDDFDGSGNHDAGHQRIQIKLGDSSASSNANDIQLPAGQHVVGLANTFDNEVLVRLEKHADRADAITAAEVSAHRLFANLFPDQVVAAERLVEAEVGNLLSVWDADCEGTIQAIGEMQMRDGWQRIESFFVEGQRGAELGGQFVERSFDSTTIIFKDQAALLSAVEQFLESLSSDADHWRLAPQQLSFAISRGEVFINQAKGSVTHAKYFGATVRATKQLISAFKTRAAIFVLASNAVKIEPTEQMFLRQGWQKAEDTQQGEVWQRPIS